MTPLLLLAEKVEGLEGPDRDTEWRIQKALGIGRWPEIDMWPPFMVGSKADKEVPAYTASLDAAMSLVPEGWGWLVSQPNEKAIASGLLKKRTPVMGEVQYGCDQRFTVAAATPALALCAAALRARAAMEAGE